MFRFLVGVTTGVYIAQTYPKEVPNITKIVDGVAKDVKEKITEYTSPK
jgi:hypothetical protein